MFLSCDVVFNETISEVKESVSDNSDCSVEDDHTETSHEEDKQETPCIPLQQSTRQKRPPKYCLPRVTAADASGDHETISTFS